MNTDQSVRAVLQCRQSGIRDPVTDHGIPRVEKKGRVYSDY